MTTPQIPTPIEIVSPAVDALVAARPRAISHIERGQYGNVIAGWQGQVRLMRARLASEAMAARLPHSSGQALRELAKSEFWAEIDESPLRAIGDATIVRTVDNASALTTGNFTAGTVPQGTKLRKIANPSVSPPIEEAQYETTATVVAGQDDTSPPVALGGGQWRHTQAVPLELVATREGPGANAPIFLGETFTQFSLESQLFDAFTVVPGSVTAAGGVLTISDEAIRQLASANYLGQYGPTQRALIAGALARFGIEHVVHVDDAENAVAKMFVADGTWSSGVAWRRAIEAFLKEKVLGFGCGVEVLPIANVRITVGATVLLADPKYSASTSVVRGACQKALRKYFDDRQDFFDWKTSAIGGTLSTSDFRVMTALAPVVKFQGITVPEQPMPDIISLIQTCPHYFLADDAVDLTFTTPS